jgi:polar amino acid transport system substrate-binding protein
MKNYNYLWFLVFLLVAATDSFAFKNKHYMCGIAEGFPPYQFKNESQEVTGFDVESLKLIFQEAKKQVQFRQMIWEDVVGSLAFTNEIDCVGGMEICDERKRYFDFTSPYFNRKATVFIKANNFQINKLEDLHGKQISGDRHSPVEALLEKKGIKDNIRITYTERKVDSMHLLKNDKVTAVIAPKAVGFYLAKQLGFKVRILEEIEISSPIGIAVKKGNIQLLTILDAAVRKLVYEGEFEKVYQSCFSHP